ncbi:MAG: zinc-ribbon domain-containing protein [Acidobacteria bacterium]|nr:zinc-ribbon domain-containing protein [Acidobacteriota bacterium]
MNSETSTNTLAPWQLFTLAGLIGATIAVFVSRGQTPAGIILLSLTVFTAAIVGVATWRTFVPFTGWNDQRRRRAVGGRTRAALEREKKLVLQSIKLLEFDQAMGKVSTSDFDEMSARLRTRAARLIRELDAGAGYRVEIEKEIALRIEGEPQQGTVAVTADAAESRPFCSQCGQRHEREARFCPHCGAQVQATR